MILMDLAIVMLLTALASGDGVAMTSQVKAYQVTFGADGRPRMEDFIARTACGYESLQSPCATYQTTSADKYTLPVNSSTVSFPLRLDFTIKNPKSNLLEVRFMIGRSQIYDVEFRRGEGITIEGSSLKLNIKFDGSQRFWVTYENGEIKAGLHGNSNPLVQYTDPKSTTIENDGIEFYSKTSIPTEWMFYEPCTRFSRNGN